MYISVQCAFWQPIMNRTLEILWWQHCPLSAYVNLKNLIMCIGTNLRTCMHQKCIVFAFLLVLIWDCDPVSQTNTWRTSVGLRLIQRRRRCNNLNPTLNQLNVFAGRRPTNRPWTAVANFKYISSNSTDCYVHCEKADQELIVIDALSIIWNMVSLFRGHCRSHSVFPCW